MYSAQGQGKEMARATHVLYTVLCLPLPDAFNALKEQNSRL
uniref:Uncharacterized protein n=1 Tax=Rhizophora mucronata TaxID=61149 RepID=A0A2P2NJZ8_RHIMU